MLTRWKGKLRLHNRSIKLHEWSTPFLARASAIPLVDLLICWKNTWEEIKSCFLSLIQILFPMRFFFPPKLQVTTPLMFKLIPAIMHLGVLMHWFPSESSTQNEVCPFHSFLTYWILGICYSGDFASCWSAVLLLFFYTLGSFLHAKPIYSFCI